MLPKEGCRRESSLGGDDSIRERRFRTEMFCWYRDESYHQKDAKPVRIVCDCVQCTHLSAVSTKSMYYLVLYYSFELNGAAVLAISTCCYQPLRFPATIVSYSISCSSLLKLSKFRREFWGTQVACHKQPHATRNTQLCHFPSVSRTTITLPFPSPHTNLHRICWSEPSTCQQIQFPSSRRNASPIFRT